MKFKTALIFLILFKSVIAFTQDLYFESQDDLQHILFDPLDNNIWEIGIANKTLFNTSATGNNVMITNRWSNYGTEIESSFIFRISISEIFQGFPYLVVRWKQMMDVEIGADGGIIEVSYDNQQSWLNIFEDTIYYAQQVQGPLPTTLNNDILALSEINSSWQNVGFCWSATEGMQYNITTMYLRFTFLADSVATPQEGWMIDNLSASPTVIDNIIESEKSNNEFGIQIYPQPITSDFIVDVSSMEGSQMKTILRSINGPMLHERAIKGGNSYTYTLRNQPNGIYILDLIDTKTNEKQSLRILKSDQ